MKIRIINDWHLYSTIEFGPKEQLLALIKDFDGAVILAGDIIDMAYCAYKDLPDAMQFALLLHVLIQAKNAEDGISEWLEGNHSLFGLVKTFGLRQFKYLDKDKKYLVHHGHLWSWLADHVQKFMSKTPGAGWFMRSFLVTAFNGLRRFLKVKPNKLFLTALAKEKAANPNLIWVRSGHNHPPKDVLYTASGVDGGVLSRGYHDFDLPIEAA